MPLGVPCGSLPTPRAWLLRATDCCADRFHSTQSRAIAILYQRRATQIPLPINPITLGAKAGFSHAPHPEDAPVRAPSSKTKTGLRCCARSKGCLSPSSRAPAIRADGILVRPASRRLRVSQIPAPFQKSESQFPSRQAAGDRYSSSQSQTPIETPLSSLPIPR